MYGFQNRRVAGEEVPSQKTASGSCGTTHGMFSYDVDDDDVVYSWNRMTSVRSVAIHSILSEMEFEMFFSILNGIL